MAATFELYVDKAGEHRWRLRHQNGNIIADSGEGYTTKAKAINGIASVKENASAAPIEEQAGGPVGSENTPKADAVRKAAKIVIETNREALKELERH